MSEYKNVDIPVKFNLALVEKIEKDGDIFLEFLASTTEKSLSGHQMELTAIEDMKRMAVGLPTFVDHDSSRPFGQIVRVADSAPSEFRPVVRLYKETGNPMVDAPVTQVKQWLDEDANMGASIGGMVKSLKVEIDDEEDDITFKVKQIILYEVSATLIPAVQSTRGQTRVVNNSVCPDGACGEIFIQVSQYIKEHKDQFIQGPSDTRVVEGVYDNGSDNKRGEIMTKELEEKVEKMVKDQSKVMEGLNVLLTEREDRIKQAEIEEAKKKEDERLATIVSTVVEKVSEKVTEELETKVEEALGTKLKELVKDRTHVQQSVNPVTNQPEIQTPAQVSQGKPGDDVKGLVFTQSVDYPDHIGGVRQKAFTPEELARMVS